MRRGVIDHAQGGLGKGDTRQKETCGILAREEMWGWKALVFVKREQTEERPLTTLRLHKGGWASRYINVCHFLPRKPGVIAYAAELPVSIMIVALISDNSLLCDKFYNF
jgi:hypothetical protein